jgi:hypothetical protein
VRGALLPALVLVLAAPVVRAGDAPEGELRLHLALSRRPHGTAEERERLRDLEYELMDRLARAGAGRLAGDAWPPGECVVTLAGPDARAMWAAVEEAVRAHRPRPGSYAALRAAGPGAREERIELGGPTLPP